MKRTHLVAGFALAIAIRPGISAAQERWLLNGAGSYSAPLNDEYANDFGAGAMGDLGGYRSLDPMLLVGARLSAGVLSDDDDVKGTPDYHGRFGIGMLSATARIRPLARRSDPRRGTGLWLEAAFGPGIVENDVRAVFSPGLGYVFDFRGVGIGPVGRYVQVIQTGDDFNGIDARLFTVGLEAIFLDAHRPKASRAEPPGGEYQPPPPPLQPAARVTPPSDIDHDGVIDANDKCPRQPETVNGINDYDGCPDDKVEFLEDRLVLGEHVLFNFDSAILLDSGKEKLREIADVYQRSGSNWKTLTVQGFTDSRGTQEYNEELGQRRAEAVKQFLISLDVPEDKVSIESFGELKPVIPAAQSEAEHRLNRRVEFAIQHQ